MPNGGSDCCGTCWFNSKNKGKPGYDHSNVPGETRCVIRGNLLIEDPFWTYCVNHPHHNRNKVAVPIGAVYICDDPDKPIRPGQRYGYGDGHRRTVWVELPDTEEIREELVRLLDRIPETPRHEYYTEPKFDHEVIRQLGIFREQRAVKGLRRILGFTPDKSSGDPFRRNSRLTIGLAVQALACVLGDEALYDIRRCLRYGLDPPTGISRLFRRAVGPEQYASIRYFAVESLAHCSREAALPLLEQAILDPHLEVARRARELADELRAGKH